MSTALRFFVLALIAGLIGMPLPIVRVDARNIGTVRFAHYGTPDIARRTIAWLSAVFARCRSYWRNDRGFATVDLLTAGAAKRRAIDPPGVAYSGSVITLPDTPQRMPIDKAIDWLVKIQRDQDTKIIVTETIDAYPWDGARAFMLAVRELYGFAQQTGTPFNPPQSISVAVDVNDHESVAWGNFELPGIVGLLNTGMAKNPAGLPIFQLTASTLKKHVPEVRELADKTRELLKTESIYRGKAVRFAVNEDDQPLPPDFIDLSRVRPEELIFSADVREQIETTIFAPILKRDWCKTLGIPFKRGVCLLGQYGVGKTLAVYVAAMHAKRHGITFILVEDAKRLPDAMLFARQYAPAVVAVEDIDRVTKDRDETCDDIMESLDGVEAKDTDVMVLMTSNHPDDIHEAMRRPGRIDTFISVDPPDAAAVERLLRLYGRNLIDVDESLAVPCHLLAGQIPAVIREVVERAKLAAVARATDLEDAETITAGDLAVAARRLLMQQRLFRPRPPVDTLADALRTIGDAMVPKPEMDDDLTDAIDGARSAISELDDNVDGTRRKLIDRIDGVASTVDEVYSDTQAVREHLLN